MTPLAPEEYRLIAELAPVMLWRSGPDGRCDWVNATWLAFTGRALADELGHGWQSAIHPDDRARVRALYAHNFERGEPFELELRLRRHDGIYRAVVLRGAPRRVEGGIAGFLASGVDVEDRRQRELGPGDAEFFELSLDHLCVAGFDGYWKRLNPSWSRTLGWTEEEMMSRPLVEFAHPDDREAILAARDRLKEGVPLLAMANRYLCKDGTYRWFEWRSVVNPERGLVYAIARDVTAEKDAERVLRHLTESLTATLNSLAEGVIATDGDAAVVRMNPAAETLTGWAAGEALGRQLSEVLRLTQVDDHTVLHARDGSRRPIAFSVAPMKSADSSVTGAVLVFRDLSAERKAKETEEQLQRQLMLADRLASVGTLAAGVAHEINNPLAYVMVNIDLLVAELQTLRDGGGAPQAADWVSMGLEARQGAERIRKIVRGLMTFSRADDERRAVVELEPILELSIAMTQNEIRHRARLVKELGAVPPVLADDSRLGQVFINLLVNAAQALPDGDTEANEIRVSTSTDGSGQAVVEVADTGPGIPEGVLGRIFDPFFTTKPVGVGTGLGLSICHSIVAAMGGQITAQNRPGRGALFRVVLPAARRAEHEDPLPASPRRETEPGGRRVSVLVVDDEPAVGATLRRLLRDHDVTAVTSAREALDLIAGDRTFDVILSDLMMPEMSGMDLYEELARRRPDVAERMVFVTGGAFTRAAQEFLSRVPNERIEKPFDVAALRSTIARFARPAL